MNNILIIGSPKHNYALVAAALTHRNDKINLIELKEAPEPKIREEMFLYYKNITIPFIPIKPKNKWSRAPRKIFPTNLRKK